MPGQRLGKKAKYKYTMDDGTEIRIVVDQTLGDLAGTGLAAITTADNVQNRPNNFTPRGVYIQAVNADGALARKRIVCNAEGSLYKSNTEQTITVDGEAFQSTGRVGEKYSFS